MHTHVIFSHPQEFLPLSYDDGIACVAGAQWFVEILLRIPDLKIDKKLSQCDWGVAIFAERDNKRFWIGLNSIESIGR